RRRPHRGQRPRRWRAVRADAATEPGGPVKRIWPALLVLLLASCGVEPAGPAAGGAAPTGLAPGVTLYFVDAQHHLRPQLREFGRLGTIAEAASLLLTGPGGADLHTEIASTPVTQVVVTTGPGVIQLMVPLTVRDFTTLGIDQLVC